MGIHLLRRIGKKPGLYLLYIAGFMSLCGLLLMPETAARFGEEDGIIETSSALLLVCAAVLLLFHAIRAFQSKQLIISGLLFLAGILCIVFAGEEISWGQRMLYIESNDFMKQHNWQGEMNFHNLQTDIFNIAFHAGAFMFLVIMPLFRATFLRLFRWARMLALTAFIAPRWIAYPSFLLIGMLDPRFIFLVEKPWAAACYLFILSVGIVALLVVAYRAQQQNDKVVPYLLGVSLLGIFLGILASYTQAVDYNPNTISEYKECFIALGLFLFAASWRQK